MIDLPKMSPHKMKKQRKKSETPVDDTRYRDIPFPDIVETYKKSAGNLTICAEKIGVNRRTLMRWRDKYSELNEMMEDVDEGLIDFTESKLMKAITEENLTAIIFYLKTKGRNRGYVERVENDVTMNKFEELMKSIEDEE